MINRHDISVVICAYSADRWDDLVAAVESLRSQTRQAAEIVVVIDHNPDLLERARAHLAGVRVIENVQTQGLSGARNSGIAAAQGSIIAFLDDDAVADPQWLATLAAGYSDPNVLGVGGPVEPAWVTGRPRWFPAEFDWVVGCTFRGMPEEPSAVLKLIGCNMSFRREVFDVVDGFRSDLGRVGAIPLASEETEFSIRVCQRFPDKTLLYDPRARVYHRVPARRAEWRYFRSRCYGEGLSKARVAQLVGAGDGLSTERSYTMRTLPAGIAQGAIDTVRRGEMSGMARAGTIVAGLGFTVAGYLVGRLTLSMQPQVGAARPSRTAAAANYTDRGGTATLVPHDVELQ
ncbi:MAG: glycosyltransferase family 2 protein [Anaerolineae bacterium]